MKLVCLGDSITDCGRLWEYPPLGNGYVKCMSQLAEEQKHALHFQNCGVDGFTIARLLENAPDYARLSADIITILIGINDIGLMMNTGRTTAQKDQMLSECIERYRHLLSALSDNNPQKRKTTQIILMEPFIFPYPEEFRLWMPYVKKMSQEIKALAGHFRFPYVLLQDTLIDAGETFGWNHITIDGIHLTAKGHQLLALKLWKQILVYA